MNVLSDERKQQHEKQVRLLKALSHPGRLAILDVLRAGEACVCHIEATLGYRQAYISQQLAVLREAGVVASRQDGWNIFYRVTHDAVYDIIIIARSIVSPEWQEGEKALVPDDCPCPKCHSE